MKKKIEKKIPLESLRKVLGGYWMNKRDWDRVKPSEIRRFIREDLSLTNGDIRFLKSELKKEERQVEKTRKELDEHINLKKQTMDLLSGDFR